jgi:hypothetical protein
MEQHSHSFAGTTTYNKGHIHHYAGISSEAPSKVQHVHIIEGITTFFLAHKHKYVTKTGPAIFLPDGRHYHYYKTKVDRVKDHIHYISGVTSNDK